MDMLEYTMRGGEHPDKETELIEKRIVEGAKKYYATNARFIKKGPEWIYNFIHFNLFWMTQNPDLIQYLYTKRPYPSYIEVETTTHCNFTCSICEHTYWDEKSQHMSLEQFTYILNQFPKLKWIGMAGIGQSFLNPQYPLMLQEVKKRGAYIELYDNCFYMDDTNAQLIVSLGLEKLLVSCDAATKATYSVLRGGSDWERVIRNIKNIDKWKKRLNSYWPELCFHFVVCKDNMHEVLEYLSMIHGLNIDVSYIQYSRMLHNFHREDLFVEIPEDVVMRLTQHAEEYGLAVRWNANTPVCKPSMNQCTAWYMPFIFVDGTVVSCCCLNEQNDRPWQRETRMGNIFDTDMRHIWYGEHYTSLLQSLVTGQCSEHCSRCPIYSKVEARCTV